jgi:hypothetical protein
VEDFVEGEPDVLLDNRDQKAELLEEEVAEACGM